MEKGKIRLIILFMIFAVCVVTLTIVFWPFIRDLRNPEYREAFSLWVQGLGFYGVLIFFGIHV
jgi:phosphotransferase system  glucose/maltose/N-acetylglucosamine-specific IIC component